MTALLTVLHVIVCLFLMLTVLLQSGKGGGMGAAFGGGNAATVFGGSGASSFLRRLTAGAGMLFMVTSMVLAWLATHDATDSIKKFGEQEDKKRRDAQAAHDKALRETQPDKPSNAPGSGAPPAMSPSGETPSEAPAAADGSAAAGTATAGSATPGGATPGGAK